MQHHTTDRISTAMIAALALIFSLRTMRLDNAGGSMTLGTRRRFDAGAVEARPGKARRRARHRRSAAGVVAACWLAAVALSPAAASAAAQTTLTARDGTKGARFGTSVSISGDTAVVGAPDEGKRGAAYVFARSEGTWVQQARLDAPVRTEGGKFGFNVAVSGDTIIVGEPKVDQLPVAEPGVAHVFVRTPEGWPHQATLSASDGKARDAFGFDVAISGESVLVGAIGSNRVPLGVDPGAAYVFTRVDDAWSEQAKLTPADGAANDQFGYSVGLSGGTAVVGAQWDDVGASVDQGSARVFTRKGSTWTEQATLTAPDGSAGDSFGFASSISGDTVAVGANFDDIGTNPKQGSAYVFTRDRGVWTSQAKLIAPDGAAADLFGRAVAVKGSTVVVGAQWDDDPGALPTQPGEGRGSVYVFRRRHSEWGLSTKLQAADSNDFSGTCKDRCRGESLGVSVGVSEGTVIGGANFAQVRDKEGRVVTEGAAYVFDLREQARRGDTVRRVPGRQR